MSTEEIDRMVYEKTTAMGGIPAPLNYQGFPKSVCTSIMKSMPWYSIGGYYFKGWRYH